MHDHNSETRTAPYLSHVSEAALVDQRPACNSSILVQLPFVDLHAVGAAAAAVDAAVVAVAAAAGP